MKILVLFLLSTFSIHAAATPENCKATLTSSKPARKSLGTGAILRLNEQLIQMEITSRGGTSRVPADSVSVYKNAAHWDGGWDVGPGTRLRTLGPVVGSGSKSFVEVEAIEDPKVRGFVYWWDIEHNTVVEQAGTPPPLMVSRPVQVKFPEKMRLNEYDKLSQEGKTAYGRPYTKTEDLVWIANRNRSMSRNNVGVLKEIPEPLISGDWNHRGRAVVELLNGETVTVNHYDCIQLSKGEYEQF